MHMMNFAMCLFRRGERRRQAIIKLLADHPDYEFTEREIYICVESWAGAVHADLAILHGRGQIDCREGSDARYYYRIGQVREEVPA